MNINTEDNKTKWLCRCDINWADEADFTWFEVFADSDKKKIENLLKKNAHKSVTIYFGTNQDGDFTGDDIDECLTWTKIPSKEVEDFLYDEVDSSEISDMLSNFEEFDDDDDNDYNEEDE